MGIPDIDYITLKINSSDLTFQEIYEIYQQIRELAGVKRTKSLDDRDKALYLFVNSLGSPPAKGERGKRNDSGEFWKKAQKEWNAKRPERKFKTWRGIQMAYCSIIESLNL
jgi:hypothetical protein